MFIRNGMLKMMKSKFELFLFKLFFSCSNVLKIKLYDIGTGKPYHNLYKISSKFKTLISLPFLKLNFFTFNFIKRSVQNTSSRIIQ